MLKKIFLGFLALLAVFAIGVSLLIFWPASTPPPPRMQAYSSLDYKTVKSNAAALVEEMTLEEKAEQLHGDIGNTFQLVRWGLRFLTLPGRDIVNSGYNERLNIPPIAFTDGPRGVAFENGATAYPVAMARAATFNPELEREVGSAIGIEARRGGYNYIASPCINLLRHPGWGRAQESYGEDPFLTERMGVAHVNGIQKHGVMSCPKHFALNSLENRRFTVDVSIDERALHEVYLPHFKAVVDSGAASLMSAYNKVQGQYAGQSRYLLEGILRDEWGWQGFVTSDWINGIYDAEAGIHAGMDIEMPWKKVYGEIPELVKAGKIKEARIDTLVRRVVAGKMFWASRAGVAGTDYAAKLSTPDHKKLAQKVAEEAMVLLKNEGNVLPIAPAAVKNILVVGPLATTDNLGDAASSKVDPESIITILEGITQVYNNAKIVYIEEGDMEALKQAAKDADVVIAVVGYSSDDEGENIQMFGDRDPSQPTWGTGGDRTDLRLKRADVARLQALSGVNLKTVAVVIGGSAITMDVWIDGIPSVLMAWYPGEQGGLALSRILAGQAIPGGRLPVSIPRETNRLPNFDPFADTVTYGYYHGYTWLNKIEQEPRFPFGFGLDYSQPSIDTAYVANETLKWSDTLVIRVLIKGNGSRRGWAVPQAYVSWPKEAGRPDGVLQAFAKTSIMPGVSQQVDLEIPMIRLRNYAGEGNWEETYGAYNVYVGLDEADARSRPISFTLEEIVLTEEDFLSPTRNPR